MKYLFFDIECANCFEHTGKIYSFGYSLVSEDLEDVLETQDYVMNPDAEFDWYVLKNILAYPKKTIVLQPKFPSFYNRIQKLLSGNIVAVGFEVTSDVSYLLDECKRYELEPFSFKYIDLRPIIRKETKEPVSSLGVEYMKWCNALPCNSHRSDADAANTLAIARALCRKKGCSFASLIAEYSNYIGETHDYIMGNKTQGKRDQRIKRSESYRELSEDKEDWLLKGSKNFVMFIRFLDYVKVSEEAPQVFANKKISISLNFEMYNFKNMLKLVQLITNAGGEYHKKASESDIFVNYDLLLEDGTVRTCSKSEYVKQAIAEGASITEISFDDLLSQLGISQASLKLMPDIDIGYLDDKKYSRK